MAAISSSGPGAVRVRPGTLEINHRENPADTGELVFVNTGDRPIQVGSHVHLPDVNPSLEFDRTAAAGFRLDIPSGTSQRFEPGASRTLPIVSLGGTRHVPGISLKKEYR